jgi:hypothetical protein
VAIQNPAEVKLADLVDEGPRIIANYHMRVNECKGILAKRNAYLHTASLKRVAGIIAGYATPHHHLQEPVMACMMFIFLGMMVMPPMPNWPVPSGAPLWAILAVRTVCVFHNYNFVGRLTAAEKFSRFFGDVCHSVANVLSIADGEVAGNNQRAAFVRGEIITGTTNKILGHKFLGFVRWKDRRDTDNGNLLAQLYDHKLEVTVFPELITFLLSPEYKLFARKYVTQSGFVAESFQAAIQTATLSPNYMYWIRYIEAFVSTITFFVQQMVITALQLMSAVPNTEISTKPAFRCTAPF